MGIGTPTQQGRIIIPKNKREKRRKIKVCRSNALVAVCSPRQRNIRHIAHYNTFHIDTGARDV